MILAFLKEFRDACESIEVHEGIAMWFFPHFLKKPASLLLSATWSAKKSNFTRLCDERLFAYIKVISSLPAIYATDDAITHVVKYFGELSTGLWNGPDGTRQGILHQSPPIGYCVKG